MVDLWLRRLHMYAALFLSPWILMYAVSAAVMNHGGHLGGPPPDPAFETVLERPYEGTLPEGATPDQIAIQLLDDLDMPGRYRARREPDGGAVVIIRESPLGQRRITYQHASGLITVEAGRYAPRDALPRLHRRTGFGSGYFKEDAWAVAIDVFVAAMLFWIVSGLWMWWGIERTRRPGFIALGAGLGLFLFFLVTI